MSGHPHTVHIPPPERLGAGRFPLMLVLAGVSIVGILLSIVGVVVNHEQFAYSWFFAFYYFFTIALGAFFWVTLHYACDSDWSVLPRRVWENMLAACSRSSRSSLFRCCGRTSATCCGSGWAAPRTTTTSASSVVCG